MGLEQALINQEQNIISLCLKNNNYILEVDKKYFISDEAQGIFSALKYLYLNEHYVGKVLLRDLHTETHKREVDIAVNVLEELLNIDIETDEKTFQRYYQDLKVLWFQLNASPQSIKTILESTQKKSSYDMDEIETCINQLQADLHEVKSVDTNHYTLDRLFDEYRGELLNRNKKSMHPTGCGHLDRLLTEGFAPGYITILFGQSGVGKSTYAWYLINKQINKMIPSIYFSLEMGVMSNMDRLCAQRLNLDYKMFYPDYLNDQVVSHDVLDLVEKEKEQLKHHYKFFHYIDADSITLQEIENIIFKYKKKMGVDYMVVTIDLLTMVRDFNKKFSGSSIANTYEDAMNELHYLSKRTNCHIVGVVQGRRPSERIRVSSVDQLYRFRPTIEELKNSGALAERSRVVLGAFRLKHFARQYLPDDPETEIIDDVMEVSVIKQNSGTLGRAEYFFDPSRYTLIPYERPNGDILLQGE